MLFSASFLLLPGDSYALVTYGAQVTHQQTTTTTGNTTSDTSQERFSFFFNLITQPSSRLSLNGDLKFDILMSKRGSTDESTELQPNITLKAATPALQVSTGYRAVMRDETIISGNKTSVLTSDSTDMFIDNSLRVGKLPDLRFRYGIRDQKQGKDGVVTLNGRSADMTASLSYKLGILAVNADYRTQSNKDRLKGDVRDLSQANVQLSMAGKIGTKTNLSLRDSYNYSDSASNGVLDSKRYTNTGDAKFTLTPFTGMAVSTNYVIRHAGDLLAHQLTSREKTWFSNASYSFPKYLKVYGSYNNRQNDVSAKTTINEATIAGANFNYSIGKFGLSSRYEKRFDSTKTENGDTLTKTSSRRDNFDWLLTWNAANYLKADISESLVIDHTQGKTNRNDRYRLKTTIGPIKNLSASPYIDYSIAAPGNVERTYNTDVVVPASYKIDLHQKISITATENYRWHMTETGGKKGSTIVRSQTNNLTLRADFMNPLPGTTLSADATFNTNITKTATVSTSTYTMRFNWAHAQHTLNTNLRFQTGSNITDSAGLTVQYGLNLMLKKAVLNIQARYNYNVTLGTPVSSNQDIYLLLRVKK